MARTWGEIKAEALQLMFSYSMQGKSLLGNVDNADFMIAMPAAANYALRDLASVSAPIVRTLSLSLNPVPNMLGDSTSAFQVQQSTGEDITYTALDPKAFYCEVDNPCTVYLERVAADGTVLRLDTLDNTAKRTFTPWKGQIIGGGNVRLRFKGGTQYNIRNVAFYAVGFPSVADIPPFTRYDRYDLRQLTRGAAGCEFMALAPNNVAKADPRYYARSDGFHWEGDSVIVFDHYDAGQYDIYYHAYPTEITAQTPDAFEPELCAEALDIVPLYIASRLYADDDISLATSYLNRYMVRRSELSDREQPLGTQEFISESGWV